MRIGNPNTAPVNTAGTQAAEKHGERAAPAKTEDAVELSRLSRAVAGEGAREARLEELQSQVRAGTYQVPAEELSKSIVKFHEE
jgi:anti-sigma28 factor (negative regulator of flagellin synthesis)